MALMALLTVKRLAVEDEIIEMSVVKEKMDALGKALDKFASA